MVKALGVSLWSKINGFERRLGVGIEYLRTLKNTRESIVAGAFQ